MSRKPRSSTDAAIDPLAQTGWRAPSEVLAEAIRGNTSDEKLGWLFLSQCSITAQAMRRGLKPDDVTHEMAREWVIAASQAETAVAKNTWVEKTLRLAMRGDFAEAGRLVRDGMADGARRMAIDRALRANTEKRERDRRARAVGRAKQIDESLAERNQLIRRKAATLKAAGHSDREVSGILSKQMHDGRKLSQRQVRSILQSSRRKKRR